MTTNLPADVAVSTGDVGKRLDQFLATHLDVSRARVQQLIAEEKVLVNDAPAKASLKLRGGERITILGSAERPPLRAIAEEIPLDIVYEDDDLAIINKPAGMMVHAGAGATEDQRNRGTLVNALLHHFATLSAVGGEMRPGIVHRLDKETSGLIVVAKNDDAHRKLAAQFAETRSEEDLHCAGTWLAEERSRNHQRQHQPRSGAPHPHDDARNRRARGHLALQRRPAPR